MKRLSKLFFLCFCCLTAISVLANNSEYKEGDYTMTGTITGEYKYKGTIDTSGTCIVPSDSSAEAHSNIEVLLEPGFETMEGSVFIAEISDDDNLDDDWEMEYFGDLTQSDNGDFDNDGLTNLEEFIIGTIPTNSDTDGDGAEDGQDEFPFDETETTDTDGDGIGDNADTDDDGDGVDDVNDLCPGTPLGEDVDENGCPEEKDTDGDGLLDDDEINIHGTDPNKADTDDDGLSDGEEVNTHGTNPLSNDSDNDGLSDSTEIKNSNDPCGMDPLNNNDASEDCDGDGYSNRLEIAIGSDRNNAVSIPTMKSLYDYDSVGRVRKGFKSLQKN